MGSGLLEVIQKAALEAMETTIPADVVFGKVVKDKPLEIKLDTNITLKEVDGVLKLSRNVTDYEISVTLVPPKKGDELEWKTEEISGGSGDAEYEAHKHDLIGKHRLKIHNKLQAGERVILYKLRGGQTYLVLDRQGEKQ